MNYGKLTAGTTKTAIDTAKPSEKGEIITYLSRMGDVLQHIFERGDIVIVVQRVHAVPDSDIPDIVLRKNNVGVLSGEDVVSAEAAQILGQHQVDLSHFDIAHHPLELRSVEVGA